MDMQFEISFYIKTPKEETISIFVDGKPLYKEKDKYIWNCDGGNHRLRIEQDKMFKSKWYWISAPLVFLMGIYVGDFVIDGKTPFYAIYEADILVDKNMLINITLFDIYRYTDVSQQGLEYKIKVDFSKEVALKIVKDEFSSTKKQRLIWFLMNTVLCSLFFGFFAFIFMTLSIRSVSIGNAIFLWSICAIFTAVWIFFVYRFYRHSRRKYKK